eukprot:Tamp_21498.p1 GENE.Tamp_21498~~Tamp_21498.p1  ORF type:complete len:155 (+),score=6.53 Tamp_21498:351-815(+)
MCKYQSVYFDTNTCTAHLQVLATAQRENLGHRIHQRSICRNGSLFCLRRVHQVDLAGQNTRVPVTTPRTHADFYTQVRHARATLGLKQPSHAHMHTLCCVRESVHVCMSGRTPIQLVRTARSVPLTIACTTPRTQTPEHNENGVADTWPAAARL